MIQCQRCHEKRETVQDMTAHLVQDHLISPSVAALEAGDYAEAPLESDYMARRCGKCHKTGHRADTCPGTTTKPPRQSTKQVRDDPDTSSVKAAAETYLDRLRALREQLDQHIESVEKMAEIL